MKKRQGKDDYRVGYIGLEPILEAESGSDCSQNATTSFIPSQIECGVFREMDKYR